MIAFVFPGQGSQKVAMGKALVERFAVAKATFAEADQALGFSLSKIIFEGPEDKLMLTAHSQPAILTMSTALWRVLQEVTTLKPAVVAGHSLGEYSALVCAGALTFTDAVKLVHARGTYMQQAVPANVGAMAAVVGMQPDQVEALCKEAAQGDELSPANFNGGGQIVIAGHAAAITRAIALAKQKSARAVQIPVSAPFHCKLMAPAATKLAGDLEKISFADPTVPVVTNVEAAPNQAGNRIKELLIQQVTAPVRWEQSVRKMAEMGVKSVYEVGPGKVLAGLIKRIDPQLTIENIETPEQVDHVAAVAKG